MKLVLESWQVGNIERALDIEYNTLKRLLEYYECRGRIDLAQHTSGELRENRFLIKKIEEQRKVQP